MTTKTIHYNNKRDTNTGMLAERANKFRAVSQNRNPDNSFDINYDDVDTTVTKPRRQLTQRQALEELLKGTDIDII